MPRMSRDEVREFDRHAIEDLGVPGVVLMENAGRQATDEAVRLLRECGGRRVVIVAGVGNKGGDGFVVARHLVVRGYEAAVLLVGDAAKLRGEAAVNFAVLGKLGIEVLEAGVDAARRIGEAARGADLVVDALLGTGLAGTVREPLRSAIEAVNESGKLVLAIDIPSGLDADTGQPLGAAVRATATVTFVAAKKGFAAREAEEYLGLVTVADIGVPRGR
jgi:NAD(P)H-hydrate epimerase